MKNVRVIIIITCLALLGALQVTAATFKPYKPQQQTKMVRSMYPMATTTPNAAFRSTSVMTVSGSEDISASTLNENGTVNAGAYGIGSSGPRRVGGSGSPGSGEGGGSGSGLNDSSSGDNSENGTPLGDAVLPLMLCALAYLGMRVYLRRKRALKG